MQENSGGGGEEAETEEGEEGVRADPRLERLQHLNPSYRETAAL